MKTTNLWKAANKGHKTAGLMGLFGLSEPATKVEVKAGNGYMSLFGLDEPDITEKLNQAATREEAAECLAAGKYGKKELQRLCKDSGIAYRGADRVCVLVDRIVEAFVGARLKHKALKSVGLR